jgi:hypothetical protein
VDFNDNARYRYIAATTSYFSSGLPHYIPFEFGKSKSIYTRVSQWHLVEGNIDRVRTVPKSISFALSNQRFKTPEVNNSFPIGTYSPVCVNDHQSSVIPSYIHIPPPTIITASAHKLMRYIRKLGKISLVFTSIGFTSTVPG